jgi:hypothetical protein
MRQKARTGVASGQWTKGGVGLTNRLAAAAQVFRTHLHEHFEATGDVFQYLALIGTQCGQMLLVGSAVLAAAGNMR